VRLRSNRRHPEQHDGSSREAHRAEGAAVGAGFDACPGRPPVRLRSTPPGQRLAPLLVLRTRPGASAREAGAGLEGRLRVAPPKRALRAATSRGAPHGRAFFTSAAGPAEATAEKRQRALTRVTLCFALHHGVLGKEAW
jgi:hypothetical protein